MAPDRTEYLGDEASEHDLDRDYAGKPVILAVEGEPVYGGFLLKPAPRPRGILNESTR